MSTTIKIVIAVSIFIVFVVGLTIGRFLKDIPYIYFNKEVKIFEIANFLLTLGIGITIPLLLKKWIEDNRSIKSALVEEIKNIISTLDKIKTIISECYSCGAITKEQKDEIIFLFHKTELQITSLNDQIGISFQAHQKRIIDKLKTIYYNYERYLTGGELMISSFDKIDNKFYREYNTEHSKVETHLKTVIHQIHKL